MHRAVFQAIPEYDDDEEVVCTEDDVATTTLLQPHQTQTIRDMIKQVRFGEKKPKKNMDAFYFKRTKL